MGYVHRYQRNRKQYNDLLRKYYEVVDARNNDYKYNAKLHVKIGALTGNHNKRQKVLDRQKAQILEQKSTIREKDKQIKALERKVISAQKEAKTYKDKMPEKDKKIKQIMTNLWIERDKQKKKAAETRQLRRDLKAKRIKQTVVVTEVVQPPVTDESLRFLNTQLSWATTKEDTKVELTLRAVVEYQNLIDSGKVTQEEVAYLGTGMQMDSFSKKEITARFGYKMTRKYRVILQKLIEVGYVEKLSRMDRYFLTVSGRSRFNTILKYIYTKKPRTYFDTDESAEQ